MSIWNIRRRRNVLDEVIPEIKKGKSDIRVRYKCDRKDKKTEKKGQHCEVFNTYIHFYSGSNKDRCAQSEVPILLRR